MARIKHILFPFEFSDRCHDAIPFVASAANRTGAKITAINVVPFVGAGMGELAAVHKEELGLRLKAKLDSLLVNEFQHLSIDALAECGEPAQAIIDFAAFSEVDLPMMPIRSFESLWRFLRGTVAPNVLREVKSRSGPRSTTMSPMAATTLFAARSCAPLAGHRKTFR